MLPDVTFCIVKTIILFGASRRTQIIRERKGRHIDIKVHSIKSLTL